VVDNEAVFIHLNKNGNLVICEFTENDNTSLGKSVKDNLKSSGLLK